MSFEGGKNPCHSQRILNQSPRIIKSLYIAQLKVAVLEYHHRSTTFISITMKNSIGRSISLLMIVILAVACSTPTPTVPTATTRDQVFQSTLPNLRLGDGVPLSLQVTVRWKISEPTLFFEQFETPVAYDSMILNPRSQEIASGITNTYPSVDSLFSVHRFAYTAEIKHKFEERLGESGVEIKEVILSEIQFPITYTQAKEQVGLKEQELTRIKQQSLVDMEVAQANKKKAEADGHVAIAQAEAQGRLQKIQAQIEETRRKSEMAKAETAKQVAEMQAQSDARRQVLLAEADLKKQRDLKDLEVQKKRDMQRVDIEKIKATDKVDFERQLELAKLCTENPVYASFLVNKELASKVQIAVLPNNADANLFGDLLKQNMSQVSNR